MYDPRVGKWLEEDPIGFEGGTPNLSEYVGNDPTNKTDPSGLIFSVSRLLGLPINPTPAEAQAWVEARFPPPPPLMVGDGRPLRVGDVSLLHSPSDARFVLGDRTGRLGRVETKDELTVRQAITRGISEGYGSWAWVLETFLSLRGNAAGQTVGTRANPIKMPDKFIPEVEKHSRSMIIQLLTNRLAERQYLAGQRFTIGETDVRWVSSVGALAAAETAWYRNPYTVSDEHLFRTYGGAGVTITGTVTSRRVSVRGAARDTEWKVRAEVTIRDNADFSASGPLGFRHLLPGWLADVYRAAFALQNLTLHPSYFHTITFTSDYTVTQSVAGE